MYFTEIENAGIDFSAESIDDMTHALLKMRDDLIKTKVAKETLEERSTSEVSFLKTQLQAEQQAKEAVEDQLSGKIAFAKKVNTVVSFKMRAALLLSTSFITRGRIEAGKAALILMKNSDFDRTLRY